MLTYTEFKQLNEKLTPSQFRPYMKMWTDELRKKYDSWFGDKVYRLYFDLNGSQYINSDNSLEQLTSNILSKYGFKIENFDALLCTKDGKNIQKINKVLNSLKSKDNSITDDLLKQLANHKEKVVDKRITKGDDLLLVISRHPYDVAGMSTDRDWHSCMNLVGGIERKYVQQDIKHGTLVAYLIDKEDTNINKPIGRTLIKPFINIKDEKDILLHRDFKWYGKETSQANQVIDKWLEEKQGVKIGHFKLNQKLYCDGQDEVIKINDNIPIDEICKLYNIENYTINKDRSIDVNEHVKFVALDFKKFPLKFNKVNGSFNCSMCNNLETLEGAPIEVEGNFNCSYCESLKNLKYAPIKVGEAFSCIECFSLETLEGAPKDVGDKFDCTECTKLKNLEGAPKKVGNDFYCPKCKNLETLKGAPLEVGKLFDCRFCPKLKSLDGIGIVKGKIISDIKN